MTQMQATGHVTGRDIPEELRPVLTSLGRGLGTVSVYGADHPLVEQIIDQTYDALKTTLQNRTSVSIGTFNGILALDDEPVVVRDVPIRTLEKRLVTMKVSHLALTKGLTRNELKQLLAALCAPNDEQMKESLSGAGLTHVKMSDVKYVALRDGADGQGDIQKSDVSGGTDPGSSIQVSQIIAFLKGEAGSTESSGDLKKMISDPERLGQMIMEAAAIRQSAVSVHDGESLADIVVGCLRRTYGGLRKETEFQSAQGKVNLTKAMMLLEKTVLDKIHRTLGGKHPEIDRRIFDAIREMEEETQFEALTAHYFEQRRKLDKAEGGIIEAIRKQGIEKVREQMASAEIPPKDWQRLMVQAGVEPPVPAGSPAGGGLDLSALAVVLEKIENLMEVDYQTPEQLQNAVGATRNGLQTYTDRIESRIHQLEGQIELHSRHAVTVEDHAEHLNREELMIEVSKLTLALLQPLTVVNAAVEASLRYADKDQQKDLLNLACESGKRMQSLTKRLMTLVGYPVLEKK